MKIEIDFDNKIITVKDSTTLGELVDKLKELKLDWKEYKLQSEISWYPYYPWTTQPYFPFIEPYKPWTTNPTVPYGNSIGIPSTGTAICDSNAQVTFNN